MHELIPPLLIALFMSVIIQNRDCVFFTNSRVISKEKFFTLLLILYLGVFCGLRTWYNDTVTYIQIYEQAPLLKDFASENVATFANGIGFAYANSVLKSLGFSTQDYLLTYGLVSVALYVKFVRRYSNNFPLSVFLMFATGFYTFTFAAIKQCIATAICLAAIPRLLRKKLIQYSMIVGIASLFHPYALVYLLLLFMQFKPWTGRTLASILIFIAVGFSLKPLIGTIVDVTTMMGGNYSDESFIGEGVNIFRVIVSFVPLALSVLYKNHLFHDSTPEQNLLFNMAMLNALIMFVGLFGTANYFARLANYFLPAQVVVLPWMLEKIGGKDRQILTILCIMGYLGYFYYGNAIQHSFDDSFSRITFFEYMRTFGEG